MGNLLGKGESRRHREAFSRDRGVFPLYGEGRLQRHGNKKIHLLNARIANLWGNGLDKSDESLL